MFEANRKKTNRFIELNGIVFIRIGHDWNLHLSSYKSLMIATMLKLSHFQMSLSRRFVNTLIQL